MIHIGVGTLATDNDGAIGLVTGFVDKHYIGIHLTPKTGQTGRIWLCKKPTPIGFVGIDSVGLFVANKPMIDITPDEEIKPEVSMPDNENPDRDNGPPSDTEPKSNSLPGQNWPQVAQ